MNSSKVEKRILMKEVKLLKIEFFLDNPENMDTMHTSYMYIFFQFPI